MEMASQLFGGGSSKKAEREARRQRELSEIAQKRAEQRAQEEGATTGEGMAAIRRAPRGQRLLLAPETGGATTLGAAS
jgi:hypothetical protein